MKIKKNKEYLYLAFDAYGSIIFSVKESNQTMVGRGEKALTRATLYAGIVILLILFIIGAWYTYERYGETKPWAERAAFPWGILVPSYAFFASSAAGAAIIASILLLYRPLSEQVVRIVRHMYVLVFGLLIPAWYIVFADLGRPDHGAWLLRGWHSSSRIAWMPVFYAVLALPIAVILIHNVFGPRNKYTLLDKALAVAAIIGAIGLEINLGQVFGNAISLIGISSPSLGAVFLVAAIGLGASWIPLITLPTILSMEEDETKSEFNKLLPYITAAPIALVAVTLGIITAWWFSYGTVSEPTRLYLEEITSGHHALVFYGVEVLLGYIAAPILAVIALIKRKSLAAIVAAILFLVAGYAEKYGMIIGAQEARLKALHLGSAINPYYLLYGARSYHVEAGDAAVIVGAFALGLLVYIGIELLLPRLLTTKSK